MSENVHIVKLPPHVTDKLQPLDATCFGPLKRLWEMTLNDYASNVGASEGLSKSLFIDLLSKNWQKRLSPTNVIAGFTKTGIFE